LGQVVAEGLDKLPASHIRPDEVRFHGRLCLLNCVPAQKPEVNELQIG